MMDYNLSKFEDKIKFTLDILLMSNKSFFFHISDEAGPVNKAESFYIPTEAVQSHQGLYSDQSHSPLSLSKLLSHPNVLVPVVLLTILLVLSLVITAGVCGYIRYGDD